MRPPGTLSPALRSGADRLRRAGDGSGGRDAGPAPGWTAAPMIPLVGAESSKRDGRSRPRSEPAPGSAAAEGSADDAAESRLLAVARLSPGRSAARALLAAAVVAAVTRRANVRIEQVRLALARNHEETRRMEIVVRQAGEIGR